MITKLRLAMLISGGGSTMQAIIQACKSGHLGGLKPVLIIASRPDAGGIEKAKAEGIPEKDILVIQKKDYPNPVLFGKTIIQSCQERAVDLIGQYGWMVKTPPNVIEVYQDMMINQHPGPLDPGRLDFGGKGMFGRRVHCARLYFVRKTNRAFWTEAIAQKVAGEYDEGLVLKKRVIEIIESDDPISLQERVLLEEHQVQIETLQDFLNGKVTILTRDEPLVLPEEEQILEEAKLVAKTLFPKG